MHRRIRGLPQLGLMIAVIALAAGLSACGTSSSGSGGESASTLLKQTFTGTHHVNSGNLNLNLTVDPSGPAALHGPYIQWTRTVKGKTVTRILTPAQYDAYAPWFASARRLRELAAELEAASLAEMARAEMARAESWAKITPGTPAPPRTRPVRGPNQPKTPKTPGDPLA